MWEQLGALTSVLDFECLESPKLPYLGSAPTSLNIPGNLPSTMMSVLVGLEPRLMPVVETSHNRMRILSVPSHLLAGGVACSQICMINSPVPGEHLENQSRHSKAFSTAGLVEG